MSVALTLFYVFLAGALAAGLTYLFRPRPWLFTLTRFLAGGAIAAQVGWMVLAGIAHAHCVLLEPGGVRSLLAIGAIVAFYIAGRQYNSPRVTIAGLLLLFLASVSAELFIPAAGAEPLPMEWTLALHIMLVVMGYCILALGCVTGVMFVVRSRNLKSPGLPIFPEIPWPSLTTLDRLFIRSIGAGVVLLAAGLVLGVATLPASSWEGAWYLDSKVILSVASSVIYVLVWQQRRRQGFSTPSAVALSILGFVFIEAGFIATSIFHSGFHKF